VSQEKLYEAVRTGRIKVSELNDDGIRALSDYMDTKDKPAEKPSLYKSLDSKIGGILPGGSEFKPSEYGISDKFAKNNPVISRGLATVVSPLKAALDNPWAERASQTGVEIETTVSNPNKTSTGSGFGDISADLWGAGMGFIDKTKKNPFGTISAGSQLFKVSEEAIERGLGLGNLPGVVKGLEKLPGAVKTGLKVGGATIPYETTMAKLNDREFGTGEAAEAVLVNAALGMALHGAGSYLGRKKSKETPLVEKEVTSPEVKQDIPADINLARNVVKNTTNLGRINRIIDAYPELAAEYPQFRLQQGDKVILPNGKEATVKVADRMIIQVDVDGKTASVGRKVVRVPETKVEVPEVVPETIPEVATPEIVTPEIKQQPIINDVPRVNNRSGAETFADENIPAAPIKQEVTPIQPEVMQETLPPTQIKVNRGSKGVANITLPDADHALLFELDKQMKMLNNDKTYSHELDTLAEQNYNKLKDKFPDPIGTADTYRRSVFNGAKDIEKDGTYAAETFEAVKAKLDAEAKRFDIPVDKRTSKNVGDRKVNAMQYNHPELKPYVQEQAKNMMGDLAASLKAERGGTTVYGENTGGENISWGNKRMTTDTIAKILDEQKVSYADIDNALQRIIDDAGQENVALAKRIELLIDEHLTDGYTDIYGNKYPPSKEYVDAKNKAYGTDIKVKETKEGMTEEEWAELEELQQDIEGGNTSKTMSEDIGLKPEKAETYDEGTIGAARLTLPEKQATLPGTNEKVRSFQRTAIDAPVTDDMTKAGLLVDIYAEGPGAYKPITNIETEAAARKFIEDNGIEVAINRVMDKTETSAEQTALAGQLTYALQRQGKHEQALNMLESLAEQLTSAGQKIQAVKIFQNLSPEGVLIKAQRETKKAFNELPKQTKDKHDNLSGKLQEEFDGIDKEAIDQVVSETPELGGTPKKKPTTAGKPGKPKTDEFDPAAVLGQKIVQWTKPMIPKAITPEMEIVRTLFKKAQEVLPKEKVKPVKTSALDEIAAALQQSDNYRKTWEDAKQSIIEQNGELPQVMKDVEAYIEHYLNVPYSERSLSRILVEAMKDKNFDLEQSAFGPMSPNFRGTKAENNAFIQSIVKDSGLTGKNAEVLSLELGSKLDEALTKKRDDKTSDLAKKIIKMATETPKGAENNPVKEMFNILMQKAKESMPKVEGAKSTKDGMLPIYNALNNRKMFNQVWSEAKKDIVKQLEAKGLSVEGVNLDQMFAELLYHPYTKGQLSREVAKGIKQYGIDVNNIVRQHFTVVDKTGQTLAEKLTTRGMLPKDEAALLAQDIQARFAEIAETKKAQILKNMFRERSLTKEQRTIDQKIIELSNLGALSKEQYRRSVAEKMGLPSLTKDTADQLIAIAEKIQTSTGNAKELAVWELHAALAALQKPTIWQKISSGQVVAQLLNLKTHIRNIIGNEGFYRAERFAKYPASLIDYTISKLTGTPRTVTFRTSGGNMINNYLEGFANEFKDIGTGIKKGAKAGWMGTRPENLVSQFDLRPKAFNEKGNIAERTMSFLENLNGAGLTAEDYAAFNRARNETLREMAVLRVMNKTGKTDKALVEVEMKEIEKNISDVANDVSRDYGKYATYQDDNVLSLALLGIKRKLNKLSTLGATEEWGLGDLVLRYARTPGALIMRGIEYSPLGVLKSVKELYVPWRKTGEPNRREAILALSRAIIGTVGMSGMGWFLADIGILTGSMDPDKDVRSMQKKVMGGAYKVNFSALKRFVTSGFDKKEAEPQKGDTLISYDWFQPLAMALSFGVNMSNNGFGKAIKGQPENYLEGMVGAINSIAEQPLFSGIQQLATKYPGETAGEQAARGLGTVIKGAAASFIPTAINQVKQLTDNSSRITYDTNFLKDMVNRVIVKLPGLSKTLPKSYDVLGEEKQTYPGNSNNPFNVFINPAFINKYNPSKEAMLAISTFQETGETNQFPRETRRYFTVSGERFDLTPDEWSQMQKIVGEKTQQGFSKISPKLRPEIQVKKMVDILGKAGEYGKIQILRQRKVKFRKSGNGLKLLGVKK